MSEENKNDEEKIPTKDEIRAMLAGEEKAPVDDEVTVTEAEEIAAKDGWVPEDQWEGDPEKWVPADEFVRRKPLFDRISQQKKQLKRVQDSLNAMKEHHSKVFERSYKKALRDLEAQRAAAEEDGDSHAVRQIEKEMSEVETEYQEEAKVLKEPAGPTPYFQEWVEENRWYQENPAMRAFADEVGIRYANSNPGSDEEDVFEYVNSRVRREYPDNFEGQKRVAKTNRPAAPAVESGARGSRRPAKKQVVLTEQERRVMNTLIRNGDMTKEQYMAEIAELDGDS